MGMLTGNTAQVMPYRDEHLAIDFDQQSAALDNERMTLTRKEYDLLALLVQHAGDIGTRLVDGAVDDVARFVDAVVGLGLPDDIALDIDLDQARRGDLLVEHAIEVDQQMVRGPGNPRGDVIINEVRHSVFVDEAIARGEIDTRLPFLR